MTQPFPRGVFAAALTPLTAGGELDLESVLPYLDFLAGRGCHGALLFGTTGEGPSFSPSERLALGREAVKIMTSRPDFTLLMGTGTPSLSETIELTRAAFDLGMQGVVVLPPYFNRKVSDEGLFLWFSQVIRRGAPSDGAVLAYNIPQMTGVPLSVNLLARLKDAFPGQFVGVKNSWTETSFAQALGQRFGAEWSVMTGFDPNYQLAMSLGGSGCITASASLFSPLLRRLWERAVRGDDTTGVQADIDRVRAVMDTFLPAPALLKGLLAIRHGFPRWPVRPPLLDLDDETLEAAADRLGI